MLEEAVEAVVSALKSSGIDAAAEFPDGFAKKISGPTVRVGLRSCALTSSGCGEYLGLTTVNGAQEELYGSRAELCVELDIFAPAAAECAAAGDSAAAALSALPAGLKTREFTCRPAEFDETAGAFRRRCELKCFAYLVRTAAADSGEFTDFVLRGVLKT